MWAVEPVAVCLGLHPREEASLVGANRSWIPVEILVTLTQGRAERLQLA